MTEISALMPVATVLLTLVNGWLIWAAGEAKKERSAMTHKIEDTKKDLSDFQIKVTQEYVRTASLKEIEDRLLVAIDRLGDRLDRLFEQKKQ